MKKYLRYVDQNGCGHLLEVPENFHQVKMQEPFIEVPDRLVIGGQSFDGDDFMIMIDALLDKGRKIPAIKLVRATDMGLGLAAAKDFVDNHIEERAEKAELDREAYDG